MQRMDGVVTYSITWGRVVMNTFKVDAYSRNCLVPQDAKVMPLLVKKIDLGKPEITTSFKIKLKASFKKAIPRQGKAKKLI